MHGLNPFRAGRCLSTQAKALGYSSSEVLIPFEQGDVFRRYGLFGRLWQFVLIPFEQGDVFRQAEEIFALIRK